MDTQELDVTEIIELSELGLLLTDPDTGEETWIDLFHEDISKYIDLLEQEH